MYDSIVESLTTGNSVGFSELNMSHDLAQEDNSFEKNWKSLKSSSRPKQRQKI